MNLEISARFESSTYFWFTSILHLALALKFEIKNVSTVPTNAAIIKMPTNNLIKQAFFTMKKVRKKKDVVFRHFQKSFCTLL